LKPYLPGAPFFEISSITNENLKKVLSDHTEGFRKGEYERSDVTSLFGGYVLKVDGEDKYFPQCCGELSDIAY